MTRKAFKDIFGIDSIEGIPIKASPGSRKGTNKALSTKKRVDTPKATSKQFKELLYKKMSEAEHQVEFIKWLDAKGIYFEIGLEGIFLPNPHRTGTRAHNIQRLSNMKVLKKLRGQGMRKGAADVKVYLPDKMLHIELKRVKKGSQSTDQKRVEKIVNGLSYAEYHLCKGFKDAIETVMEALR